MPFLRSDSRICAGSINKRDDGEMKSLRKSHQSKRFSITFRMSAAKVATNVFFRIASLLMGNDNTPKISDLCKASRHCFVIAEKSIAMKFDKFRKCQT